MTIKKYINYPIATALFFIAFIILPAGAFSIGFDFFTQEIPLVDGSLTNFHFENLNGDGKTDVVVTNKTAATDAVFVCITDNMGMIPAAGTFVYTGFPGHIFTWFFSDINGDSRVDAIIMENQPGATTTTFYVCLIAQDGSIALTGSNNYNFSVSNTKN